jgi:CrcB protein
VGVLGGFTTFSSFSYETLALLQDGEALAALAYALGSLLLGFFLVYLGYRLGGMLVA